MQDIEQLADDIAINGLLQAPLVQDMHNGRYQLISGHRRCAALNLLVKRGEVQFRKVLCSIDNDSDEISVGLKLIAANQNVRQKNNGEILAEAETYIKLMSERKKQEKLQGRVRDMVAKQLDISSASLAELLAIGKNLTEPLLTWFKSNQITKSVAVEISKCAKDTQIEIANMITQGKEFTVKDVKQWREALEVEENAEKDESGENSTEITPDEENYDDGSISDQRPDDKEGSGQDADREVVQLGGEIQKDSSSDMEESQKTWSLTSGWVPLSGEWKKKVEAAVKQGISSAEPCIICKNGTGCNGCCRMCQVRETCSMNQAGADGQQCNYLLREKAQTKEKKTDTITEAVTTADAKTDWTPDEVESVLTWVGNIKTFCKKRCKRDEYNDFQCDCPFIRAHHGYITCILTGDDEYAPEDWNYE